MLNLGESGFNRYLSRANFATSQAYDLYPTSVSPPKQQSKKESKKAQNGAKEKKGKSMAEMASSTLKGFAKM